MHTIHCMANLEKNIVIVKEIQKGICLEEDIVRYIDAYGRNTVLSQDPIVVASISIYNDILQKIKIIEK